MPTVHKRKGLVNGEHFASANYVKKGGWVNKEPFIASTSCVQKKRFSE